MFLSAEKSTHVSRQQQAAGATFFRKAGEESFFGNKKQPSFFSPPVQAKLSVSSPDDPQEKEADAVADKVMRMSEPAATSAPGNKEEEKLQKQEEKEQEPVQAKAETPVAIHRKEDEEVQAKVKPLVQRSPVAETQIVSSEPGAHEEEEKHVSAKRVVPLTTYLIQRSARDPPASSTDFEQDLSSTKGQGSALPASTQQSMENRFNSDFSRVRVHTGIQAENLSRNINAQAFTHGNDIYFNSGKYSPNTAEGGTLLAHELTHTVQQGASSQVQRKVAPPPIPPPAEVTSLSNSVFAPSEAMGKYIEEGRHAGKDIRVSFANLATGTIKVKKKKETFETTDGQQGIALQLPFLQPLINAGIQPMLAISIKDNNISGYMTVRVGKGDDVGSPGAIFDWVRNNPVLMKWSGLKDLVAKKENIVNKIEGNTLRLEVKDIKVNLGGFVNGTFNLELVNTAATVEGNAIITVKSLANGTLNFRRDEAGNLKGTFEMQAQVKNFTGSVQGAFLNGIFDIHGKLRYTTEKLTGEINIIVTDPKQAKQIVLQQMEPQQISKEAEERAGVNDPVTGPQPGPRAIAGWGTLEFAFNKWLTGMAKVVVDDEGYITVHGEITPPAEVPIFGAKPYRSPNFIDLHPTFRWGIPYIADLHVGLDFLLYAEAQIGPAVLRNIKIIGNYSTDPLLFNDFRIQGTFNLMGYAGLVFEFGAHAGVGILGFDIDLKGILKATAGIKAYVEATPVIGYREKADPVAGKKGEFFISGQAEVAAQPFLSLEGIIALEVDSPWPIPNFGRSWDMFKKEYPLPGQFGVGLTFGEYILGSGEWPNVDFNKVNFDPDKFKDDLIDRNVPPKEDHPTEKKGGFADKNLGQEPAPPPPPVAVHKPAGNKGKDGKEAKPATAAVMERWVTGMKAVKALKDKRDEKPEPKAQLLSELNSIKRKFKFTQLLADPMGQNWSIYAEMPGVDNSTASIVIKGLAEEKKEQAPVDKTGEQHTGQPAPLKTALGAEADWIGIKKDFKAEDEHVHHLYFKKQGDSAILIIESHPTPYSTFLAGVEVDDKEEHAEQKKSAKTEALKIAGQIEALKNRKVTGANDAETRVNEKQKDRDIADKLQELSQHTAILFGAGLPLCGEPVHVPSADSNKTFGITASIKPLTRRGHSILQGTPPTDNVHDVYSILALRRGGDSTHYKKGHLLNEHLKGVGTWKNLTPLTTSANSAHEGQVESIVKAALDTGAILEYIVRPVYPGKRSDRVSLKEQMRQANVAGLTIKQQIVDAEDNVPTALECNAWRLSPLLERVQQIVRITIPNTVARGINDYTIDGEAHFSKVVIDLSADQRSKLITYGGINESLAGLIVNARGLVPGGRFSKYADLADAAVASVAQPDLKASYRSTIMSWQQNPQFILYPVK